MAAPPSMAANTFTSTESLNLGNNHPLYLHPSDTPGAILSSVKLTGTENYSVWSRSMLINLRAKSKLGFVLGTTKKRDFDPLLEEQWEKCNAFVLAWIMNTVSQELLTGIVYASDAATVWADLKERFDKIDGSRIYQIHRETCTITQVFDPGNNNYINTTTLFQANWWPYGETFFKYPTGRACDGRLIPDFIAEYAELPLIPPYFQIGNRHFVHGVNFASAGSGGLLETNRGFVIDLKTQFKYFKNTAKLLKKKVGATKSKQSLSNAVYIFSTGNNDYLAPIFANATIPYSERQYQQMILGNFTSVLKGIYKEGGRKFVILNLAPLGCVPTLRALNVQKGVKNGSCIEEITNMAKMFNSALPEMLKQLEKKLPAFKYTVFNFFKVLTERIDNPTKYGFKNSKTACCGTGPFRGVFSCGGKRQVKEYELCKNVKDYLFFDSVHPTELAYQQIAKLLWNGSPDVVAPYNVESFFERSA